ncbi:Gfo/Idh/MocA family oxidoreductase [Acidipropionibacterium jensenii]|uniref:Gfo/Idh/MocA family oxidoreductase n=1 Tax=Acidipropionibacterium jensenii TaxID=1749 RepID=UPI00264A3DC3|nr:Gfo/Idh/MocA family oxidoreductase [Acidipropionibacterium jensenii]MDN6618139.1 Gfo/Idh/MocA family oxidoreductase [Corynebacterium variabile]MDN5995956.1 Gfo/Idh/MocA family oxidoreductase [Acidipropionibacterium jensenii]MDN6427364.1 Gfo/Idh/MocA family oxidoreductase [Acidipropionibacterium jensenii]MDN6480819.1 Gfo/Idh/MocA family oxidoreductase [Acidipropionibacterium jensenii]MDN6512857.1 Gfo/Idh/MocA family oxidoreductase [Acidipropionibacterium jensenii]
MSTSDPILGVLGTGRIGADHARTISTLSGIGGILVADAVPESAQKIAQELGATAVSPDEIFDKVDGLVITTPTSTHAELIKKAVAKKIPTFTEKPIALDVPTTREVVDVVNDSDVLVQVGFMRRFNDGYANARKLLAEGAIGELRRGNVTMGDTPAPPESFIKFSGGINKDCLIHDADITRWVTGQRIEEVYEVGFSRGADYFARWDDIDEGGGVWTLADDSIVTFQTTRNNGAGYDIRLELFGTKDTISVGFDTYMPITSAEPGFTFEQAGDRFQAFYPRFIPAYKKEIGHFVQAMKDGSPSVATVNDALEALYVCDAMDLSRKEHRPVKVDEIRQAK